MFGCTDPDAVLKEIGLATKAFPDAYIRVAAFDNVRQVAMFLVHRPPSASDYRAPEKRSK
jgi:ribulose-bisphosphate carboxylase small chain